MIGAPLSSYIALTLPRIGPHTTVSPCLKVPRWMRTDATAPLFLSSLASITAPFAWPLGSALSSMTSAVRSTFSRRSSIPVPCLAEIGTMIVWPPHSSQMRPYCVSSCLTLSGFAPGLSILLIATMISVLAALAWLIASIV